MRIGDFMIMYTCHLWWNYTAQSFHQLKVAFNNAFRMMHNLPTYSSASEMMNDEDEFMMMKINLLGYTCKYTIAVIIQR